MISPSDRAAASEARDHRRWLIGLGITLAFGMFGVIMALLSYSERARPGASSPAQSPAAAHAEPAKHPRGRRDHDKWPLSWRRCKRPRFLAQPACTGRTMQV